MLKGKLNPFRRSYSSDELNLFGFLGKVKLFERLSYEEMALFVPYLYLREYAADEAVFFRGDPSHALYIVKNGEVALNIDVKDKFEELARVYPGNAFGDNSLIEKANRIFTSIVVSEGAELYVIPQVNLHQIMNDNMVIRAKIMTSFSEVYNRHSSNLVKAYRNHFGFFDLGLAYKNY